VIQRELHSTVPIVKLSSGWGYAQMVKPILHGSKLYSETEIHDGAEIQMDTDWFSCRACQIKPGIYMSCFTSSKEIKMNLRLFWFNTKCSSSCILKRKPPLTGQSWSQLKNEKHKCVLCTREILPPSLYHGRQKIFVPTNVSSKSHKSPYISNDESLGGGIESND
jgi:hypothetical protein